MVSYQTNIAIVSYVNSILNVIVKIGMDGKSSGENSRQTVSIQETDHGWFLKIRGFSKGYHGVLAGCVMSNIEGFQGCHGGCCF